MKTLGLLVTIAIVLPLTACESTIDATPDGWCPDPTAVIQCFTIRDCAPDYRCDQGICVVRSPGPPGRGASGPLEAVQAADPPESDADVGVLADGGSGVDGAVVAGYGGSTAHGGTVVSGTGGSVISAVGGSVVSGYGGSTGHGGSVVSGTGGSAPPPAAADAPHTWRRRIGHVPPAPDAGVPVRSPVRPTGRCLDGECQRPCATDGGCGTGQVCNQGFCETPTTSGGQCVFNADCGGGAPASMGPAMRVAGRRRLPVARARCVANICQPDTGPRPQCRSSGDCVGVHVTEDVCVDAVCRTECASNDDCCVGSSGSVCQMGFCVTEHEVAPQCRISADCGRKILHRRHLRVTPRQ